MLNNKAIAALGCSLLLLLAACEVKTTDTLVLDRVVDPASESTTPADLVLDDVTNDVTDGVNEGEETAQEAAQATPSALPEVRYYQISDA